MEVIDWLVVDASNILHRAYYKEAARMRGASGLAAHVAITSLNFIASKFKPTKGIVCCFDRTSWRRAYTASEQCISQLPYKGNRDKSRAAFTEQEKIDYVNFKRHVKSFEDLLKHATSLHVLAADDLEGDDLVGGFVSRFPNDKIVIASTDGDYIQLCNDNVRIYCPVNKKVVDKLSTYDNNPDYFLFVKCIRGDTGDMVGSAYPGVRTTRIKKAYDDAFEREKLFCETWSNGLREFKVGELFEENKLLMGLQHQPPPIREFIQRTINEELSRDKRFNLRLFSQYAREHDLRVIVNDIDKYARLLAYKCASE